MNDEEKLDLMGCGIYMGSRWSKQNTIAELEKIKAEIAVIPTQICLVSQDKTTKAYRQRSLAEYEKDLFELIDNHISELKGDNNE